MLNDAGPNTAVCCSLVTPLCLLISWQQTNWVSVRQRSGQHPLTCCCSSSLTLAGMLLQVENPIPFAEPWTAKLTTGYLHAKYFHLLLIPIWLSADWSYSCIPYVKTLLDPRNVATAAAYTTVLWGFASCRPLETAACAVLHGTTQKQGFLSKDSKAMLREHREHGQRAEHAQQAKRRLIAGLTSDRTTAAPQPAFGLQQTNRTADVEHREAVWVMVVMTGLVLAPFLPASNLLFYVGTFIGERLLYMPSAGFCLLLSHFIGKFLDPSERCWVRSALQWLGLSLPDQAELNGRMQQTHAQGTGHSQASLGQGLLRETAEGSHGQQPHKQQHQQHLDALQPVPKQPQTVPHQPQTVPKQPQAVPKQPQTVPNQPQTVPKQPQTVPNQPQTVPKQPQAVPQQPQTVPKQPQTVPKQPQTVPKQPQTVPKQPQTVPKQPQQGVQCKAKQEQGGSWLGLALVCLLLMGYTCRTVTRNWDWQDEETLFIAAQKVLLVTFY